MSDTIELTEQVTPQPAEGLARLLDVDVPDTSVPPLWHWVYLLDRRAHSELGPDGHPTVGIPAPPGSDRRRMFAGGRVTTYGQLRMGEPATRVTRVVQTVEKQGRSGPLTFCTVRHELSQDSEVVVVDEDDIVYRSAHSGALPPVAEERGIPERGTRLELRVDEALLFRFSALTYNAHRIHYDRDWAAHEGYAGLVVHGPLQALMMGEAHGRSGAGLVGRTFEYRLVAPMVGPQTLTVVPSEGGFSAGAEVWDEGGRRTATSVLVAST